MKKFNEKFVERMMGEDTEDIARNYGGCSPVQNTVPAANAAKPMQTEHRPDETVQISDAAYAAMTFAGPV